MARKEKVYISVDIEASGPTPGKYSMLSIGACVVGNTDVQFYRELKPISDTYVIGAMKVGCLGLECLQGIKTLDPEYDAKSPQFNPRKVLSYMSKTCQSPERVMSDFSNWLDNKTEDKRAIEVAAPIKFDGMFTAWYFDNFNAGYTPFAHSGEDINSMYRGATGDIYAHISHLRLKLKGQKHNALDDAIYQAKKFSIVLEMLNNK